MNSERLNELAKERQRGNRISFGEALSQVAAENPNLALPGTTIDFEERGTAAHIDQNGAKLTALAKKRQREDKISFGEALSQVAAENPELTLPRSRK